MKIVICAEKMVDTQSNTTPTTWDAGTMKIWRRKAIYQERTVVDVKEEWFIIPHEETSRMSQSRLSYHYSIPWPTSFFSAMPWHKILTEPSKLAPWCFWSPRKHPGTWHLFPGPGNQNPGKKVFWFFGSSTVLLSSKSSSNFRILMHLARQAVKSWHCRE